MPLTAEQQANSRYAKAIAAGRLVRRAPRGSARAAADIAQILVAEPMVVTAPMVDKILVAEQMVVAAPMVVAEPMVEKIIVAEQMVVAAPMVVAEPMVPMHLPPTVLDGEVVTDLLDPLTLQQLRQLQKPGVFGARVPELFDQTLHKEGDVRNCRREKRLLNNQRRCSTKRPCTNCWYVYREIAYPDNVRPRVSILFGQCFLKQRHHSVRRMIAGSCRLHVALAVAVS